MDGLMNSQLVYVGPEVKGRALVTFHARRSLKDTYQRHKARLYGPFPKRDARSSFYRVAEITKNPVAGGHYVNFVWGEHG